MRLLLLFRNRRIDARSLRKLLSEWEIRGLSSIFGAARKYGSGRIEQVILIGWKMFGDSNGQIKLRAKQKVKFLSATYSNTCKRSILECKLVLIHLKLTLPTNYSLKNHIYIFVIFVAASHQTGLDTRSKARRPNKVGIKGRGKSGTSWDSNPAGLCYSSTH